MPQAVIITLIVVAFTAVDGLIVWGLLRAMWGPWQQKFPAQPVAADAVTREFQSFKFGMMNCGYSIHVSVDDHFLHLAPAAFLRLFGLRAFSIPWEEIVVTRRRGRGKWIDAKVGINTLRGPAWCLEIAQPASDDQESGST
jgi:hypothetical protein